MLLPVASTIEWWLGSYFDEDKNVAGYAPEKQQMSKVGARLTHPTQPLI